MSGRPRTIRVLIHLQPDGRAAVGVIGSLWDGPDRVDRRLAAARPLRRDVPPCPPGVPEAAWLAWQALGQRIEAWQDPDLWKER